jgi:predicted RNA-binding protein YlxR (DUF448 family)
MACRTERDKREMIRFCRTGDGSVRIDPGGREAGRGAYLCKSRECFDLARSRKRFASALKTEVRQEDLDRLSQEFDRYLASESSRDGR